MIRVASKQNGAFTIVELLIVIVVIGVLAAITVVSYKGVTGRARSVRVQAELKETDDAVRVYYANHGQYPSTLADANVGNSDGVVYQYTSDNTVTPRTYAITASNDIVGSINYYVTNTDTYIKEGVAPGHNIMPWDKPSAASAPVTGSGVSIDTSTYRTEKASIKIAATYMSRDIRIKPVTGTAGQVVTLSLWIKTDSNWNGTSDNSKIRFGNSASSSALLTACSLAGVKTTWTYVSCSYTLTSTINAVTITVGNNGTVGNIWLDDISLSIK